MPFFDLGCKQCWDKGNPMLSDGRCVFCHAKDTEPREDTYTIALEEWRKRTGRLVAGKEE